MERQPKSVPLSCYGLEHDASARVCQECKFSDDCSKVSKVRSGKVPLNKVTFRFSPPEITGKYKTGDVASVYSSCYKLVYPDRSPDNITRIAGYEYKLKLFADEAGCSEKMFIMCCMMARKATSEDMIFYANYLFAKGAVKLVEMYRIAVSKRYGVFDTAGLGLLLDTEDSSSKIKRGIQDSELTAGLWIVGYKLNMAGSPTDPFFAQNEFRLNPTWLCLEKSYGVYHDTFPAKTPELEKFRQTVHQTNSWLRKNKKVALQFFELREKLFHTVVADVLHHYGYLPEHFESPPEVTDALKFWTRIALAIQHHRCLKQLELDA